jgi:hypothetical protein
MISGGWASRFTFRDASGHELMKSTNLKIDTMCCLARFHIDSLAIGSADPHLFLPNCKIKERDDRGGI